MNEYLSSDRINLISKLISVYEKRISNTYKNFILPRLNSFNTIDSEADSYVKSPSLLANLLITYIDHTSKFLSEK